MNINPSTNYDYRTYHTIKASGSGQSSYSVKSEFIPVKAPKFPPTSDCSFGKGLKALSITLCFAGAFTIALSGSLGVAMILGWALLSFGALIISCHAASGSE